MKLIKAINIFLLVLAVVLFLNLFHPATITTKVFYSLARYDPKCVFYNNGELSEIPLDRCCYDVQNQLDCEPTDQKELDLRCYTSKTSERYYLINYKAFRYCEREGYDVKAE